MSTIRKPLSAPMLELVDAMADRLFESYLTEQAALQRQSDAERSERVQLPDIPQAA